MAAHQKGQRPAGVQDIATYPTIQVFLAGNISQDFPGLIVG